MGRNSECTFSLVGIASEHDTFQGRSSSVVEMHMYLDDHGTSNHAYSCVPLYVPDERNLK